MIDRREFLTATFAALAGPRRRVDAQTARTRLILLGTGEPIVLCALDWIGIANESHDQFCAALAQIADHAVEARATVFIHDRRNNHGVATRLQPIFPPSQQLGPEVRDDDAVTVSQAL